MPAKFVIFVVCAVCVAAALWDVNSVVSVLVGGLAGAAMTRLWSDSPGHASDETRDRTAPDSAAPAPDTQHVLDALQMAALIVRADRSIVMANTEAHRLFGLNALAGQPVAVLRAPPLLDGINAALSHGQSRSLDLTLSRAGDLHLVAQINPMGTDVGDLLIVLTDETTIRDAAAIHRDFVANASHELKTPLAASSGIIETLLGPARGDEAATERFLGLLADQTVRMHRLVEDLLSLNRIELNERVAPDTAVPLGPIADEAIAALEPVAVARDITLEVERAEPTPVVRADPGEIGQLIRNLIENAIKHGGAGGRIEIDVGLRDPARPGMAGVSVRDHGPGIAKEDLPRLTERFYRVNTRTSRQKGGTGLGLAICKHIVARHRGRLEIDSEIDRGTCFTVWLLVADTAQAERN